MGRLRYPYRLGSRFPARRPGHYTLDPYLVLDIPFLEGTGSKVEDRSIHKNIGTIEDGTWKAQGIRGPCLEFDGDDDYVDCGSGSSLDLGAGDFSIESWIKLNQVDEYQHLVIKGLAGIGANRGVALRVDLNNLVRGICTGDSEISIYSASALLITTWYHIVLVKNTNITVYVDAQAGTPGASPAGSINNTYPLEIGRRNDGINYVKALIDEVRIFSRALSAQEILDRYESMKL